MVEVARRGRDDASGGTAYPIAGHHVRAQPGRRRVAGRRQLDQRPGGGVDDEPLPDAARCVREVASHVGGHPSVARDLGHAVGRTGEDVEADDHLHLRRREVTQPAPLGALDGGRVQDEVEGDVGAQLGERAIGVLAGRPDPAGQPVDPLDRRHDAAAFSGDPEAARAVGLKLRARVPRRESP